MFGTVKVAACMIGHVDPLPDVLAASATCSSSAVEVVGATVSACGSGLPQMCMDIIIREGSIPQQKHANVWCTEAKQLPSRFGSFRATFFE